MLILTRTPYTMSPSVRATVMFLNCLPAPLSKVFAPVHHEKDLMRFENGARLLSWVRGEFDQRG